LTALLKRREEEEEENNIMAKLLLTLDTLTQEHDTIEIDGVSYDVLAEGDFGLDERAQMVRTSKKVVNLFDSNEKSDQARRMLTEFVRQIMPDLPKDVLDKLKDEHKLRIMNAFIGAVSPTGN
jgi:hypothetical protein